MITFIGRNLVVSFQVNCIPIFPKNRTTYDQQPTDIRFVRIFTLLNSRNTPKDTLHLILHIFDFHFASRDAACVWMLPRHIHTHSAYFSALFFCHFIRLRAHARVFVSVHLPYTFPVGKNLAFEIAHGSFGCLLRTNQTLIIIKSLNSFVYFCLWFILLLFMPFTEDCALQFSCVR